MSSLEGAEKQVLRGLVQDPKTYWPSACVLSELAFGKFRKLFEITRTLICSHLDDGTEPTFSELGLQAIVREMDVDYSPDDIASLFEIFHPSKFADGLSTLRDGAILTADEIAAMDRMRRLCEQSTELSKKGNEWPDLVRIDDSPLCHIDCDCLPSMLADMVRQVSDATETPAEMALTVALGAIATATARKWNVQIEQEFIQSTNLYLCCVMPPGNRKSAVFRRMFNPISDYERRIRQDAESDFQRTRADFEIWEKQTADLKSRIAKANCDEQQDLRRELESLLTHIPQVQHKPQLVSDDVTPESVCDLLSRNHERLGIASAEPEVFDLILGRYSKGPNLGLWLKGHDGDRHTENRRNRPEPIVLNSPLLSLTIMAQPEAVQSAGSHRVMRGRGMLDRFLFSCPPSPVGQRQCVSGVIDSQIERRYHDALESLLFVDIPLNSWGTPEPAILTFSRNCHQLWKAEQIRIERDMADCEPLSVIAGWGAKFAAQIGRIAANLHLFQYGDRTTIIDDVTMQAAIQIGRMFESHTRAAFLRMAQSPAIATAHKVVKRVVDESLQIVSRRDVMRFDRTIDVRDAQTTIDLLIDHGYLVPQEQDRKRGRPSDRYKVNPELFHL